MADSSKKPAPPQPPEPKGWLELLRWRWIILVWAVVLVLDLLFRTAPSPAIISYSQVKSQLAADNIASVRLSKERIRGKFRQPVKGKTRFAAVRVEDPKLLEQLFKHKVEVTGARSSSGWWWSVFTWVFWGSMLVLVFLMLRRGGTAGPGMMGVGRSRAKLYMENEIKVSFDDVAGVDEAKQELREVIEFLTAPERFNRLGGTLPKGILLVGPPGTGKTLLARAVAGEAGVPFFSISGSAFVEMFVGVGAARVRDLFKEARQKAPCIIFIDELDALGKARGAGPVPHEEREQTLNQLLVELDGFDPGGGVVLMAATNRPEILDPALLRPGRFDRHITVDRPDRNARLAILEVHARKVRLADDVNLEAVAAMTPGLAGADLANIVNEAALLAVRRRADQVENVDMQSAVERVVTGMEKRSRVLSPDEKRRVAYHETGHALTALTTPGADPVHKISIIPRGIAGLGFTMQLPHEERFLMTKTELLRKIAVLLGGRVAEELIFGDVSTGAQDDLRKATDIARSMVVFYGMSDELANVSVERAQDTHLGVYLPQRHDYSEHTAEIIDREVRDIIARQHEVVRALLRDKRSALDRAAAQLLLKETLSGEELQQIADSLPSPVRAA